MLVATFVAACSTQLHDALFFGNKVTGGGEMNQRAAILGSWSLLTLELGCIHLQTSLYKHTRGHARAATAPAMKLCSRGRFAPSKSVPPIQCDGSAIQW